MRRLLFALALLVIFAAPVQAQEAVPPEHERSIGTPLKLTIAGVIITQGIDTNLTTWLLAQSGDRYREANPIVRPVAHRPATLAILKSSIGVAAAYALYSAGKSDNPKTRKAALITGIGLSALTGVVVYNNYQHYQNEVKGR